MFTSVLAEQADKIFEVLKPINMYEVKNQKDVLNPASQNENISSTEISVLPSKNFNKKNNSMYEPRFFFFMQQMVVVLKLTEHKHLR